MSFTRKVTLDQLVTELRDYVPRNMAYARGGVQKGAKRAVGLIQSLTPVDTGRLRASNRVVDTELGADIENPTPYAGIVDHRQGYIGDNIDQIGRVILDETVKEVHRRQGR